MKSKFCQLCVICLVSVLILSFFMSCAPKSEIPPPSPHEITDQLGRVVRWETTPQRIISLAPSNTEILFALGLADRVVAVTDYCDYPPEAKTKPTIGGFSTPNIEEVVALAPDLVLATSIHEKRIIPQLESRGLTVLALNPKTLDEVLAAITLVGQVTDTGEKAAELVASMQQRIKAVTDKTAVLPPEQKPRTFYVVWHDPLMTAGSGTLQDELTQKAGGTNIASGLTDYADITLEAVIKDNPQVIICGTSHGSTAEDTFQYISTETRLRDTDARRNSRIHAVDSDLSSRPGPRIVEGLEQFAQFIHPELFK